LLSRRVSRRRIRRRHHDEWDLGGLILQDVVRAVAREHGWPGITSAERTLGASDPSDLKDFAGRYEMPTRSPPVVIEITVEGNRLYRGTGRMRSELMPENATTFFAMDSDFASSSCAIRPGRSAKRRCAGGG
jgi:hypothetical protein